jgi:L-alanine-DL-glutamate epimerase-like enolase superfamily enzyme
MRIRRIEAIPLAASFKQLFRFGTTDRTSSPNVLVRILTDEGVVGWGEACPVQAFTSETQASVVELVETRIAPALVGRDRLQRAPLLDALARVLRFAPFTFRFAPFTFAAVDTALLDLAGRHTGVPASTLLGGAFRDRVEVHGSVTWDEDPARVVETALEQRETYRWLKLYAGRDEVERDLDRLQAVRDAVGPDVRLLVDVNGMWSVGDATRALARVEEIGLELIEQPLPVAAAHSQRDLVTRCVVDIAADESVRCAADAVTVVREGSATVVNVGMSKLGGPTVAQQAAQIASAGGLGVMVGGVIELGVATAMGLHLAAALPDLAYPSYLMGPLKYREQITVEPLAVVDAHVAVPAGPGLGIDIDEEAVHHLDARR